ncbi:MAG: bifunctional ornithine acetyltransferase/N-acetylglutamate synthase [Eggerthellaceae bacterium]|nr:bifunctional ornithine acetyltransferase/N-acetylglutamate synthase [Eggerthellaceae bacterium]
MMKTIPGGVCAAAGFAANGVHCGIRAGHDARDLALIVSTSEKPASAAAVYTTNKVKGAPLIVTAEHIADGSARAIICNSGNANTCNADGYDIAQKMSGIAAAELGFAPEDIVVASTGVIGQPLCVDPIAKAMPKLAKGLQASEAGSTKAEQGIMTTDTVEKQFAVSFTLPADDASDVICHIGGIAKGSGMIHPNMATMLVFITTDVAIDAKLLHEVLVDDVQDSFNMVSVDGDTSTNDMVVVLANGEAGNAPITKASPSLDTFKVALAHVTQALCRMIAHDGEGATKLLTCMVSGAKDKTCARTIAKAIICSSLVKAAFFGADANWGRILCAIGYCGADVDIEKVDVDLASAKGTIAVCRDGSGVPFDEDIAKEILLEDEIDIIVGIKDGLESATAWGCDLTYDYVKINGDYRT